MYLCVYVLGHINRATQQHTSGSILHVPKVRKLLARSAHSGSKDKTRRLGGEALLHVCLSGGFNWKDRITHTYGHTLSAYPTHPLIWEDTLSFASDWRQHVIMKRFGWNLMNPGDKILCCIEYREWNISKKYFVELGHAFQMAVICLIKHSLTDHFKVMLTLSTGIFHILLWKQSKAFLLILRQMRAKTIVNVNVI